MTNDLVRPTIPVAYLADMTARAPKHAVREALVSAGLPTRALSSARMRVSIASFERFHATLVRAIDDEMFGFFPRPVPRGSYAMLVRLLVGCEDLSGTIRDAARFYRLFCGRSMLRLETRGGEATISMPSLDRTQARSIFFAPAFLVSAWRTAAWLVGRALPLEGVVLPMSCAPFRSETRHLFGREPAFAAGAPHLVLRVADTKLPVVRAAHEARAWATDALRGMLLPPEPSSTARELRLLLAKTRPIADVSLGEAARRLGLSRASLARELARLGTTFLRVKDELRRDHAIALLTDTTLDLEAIGARLGYSGARAFQRAFREWTGMTAGALRDARGSHTT